MKKNNGITLIALIITIVVLIILAGVAITLSLGDNGIFRKASKAKENTLFAQNEESMQIAEATNSIDGIVGSSDRATNNTNQTWKRLLMNENGYVTGGTEATLPESFTELYIKTEYNSNICYTYNILYDSLTDEYQSYYIGLGNGATNYYTFDVSKTKFKLSAAYFNNTNTMSGKVYIWYK